LVAAYFYVSLNNFFYNYLVIFAWFLGFGFGFLGGGGRG
jgi:hypothetical protein